MVSWIRKSFDSVGLTQVPAGPHLRHLQSRFGGVVILMIDVSGSMHGAPILQAVEGARAFVQEAAEANYQVGLMLWNTQVVALAPPTLDGAAAMEILRSTSSASGGNALDGPLTECHCLLDGFTGDRVVALFGDGDLTPRGRVLDKVAVMKADNIRFVTRGLGASAAQAFAEITDEDPATVEVASVDDLATGIASMAVTLKKS